MEVTVELINDYVKAADLLSHGAGHLKHNQSYQSAVAHQHRSWQDECVLLKQPQAAALNIIY